MKKTFNINLAGRVFTIDEDAYFLLKDYLDTLSHVFDDSDSEEVVSDIESRISELFFLELGEESIITKKDVEAVIARIGKPEDIVEIREDEISSEDKAEVEIDVETVKTPPPFPGNSLPAKKKLFRDSNRGMLGGVCAGLAVYLNVDVTWIRLAFVALCFLSLSTIFILYLILWIVLPDARTPIQQMQMYGESPTLQNIGKSVKDNFDREYPSYTSTPQYEPVNTSGQPNVFLRILIMLICILFISFEVILIIGLLAGIFSFAVWGNMEGWTLFSSPLTASSESKIMVLAFMMIISGIFLFGIPLYFMLRYVFKGSEQKKLKKSNKIVLWTAWVISFIVAIGCLCGMGEMVDSADFNLHIENEKDKQSVKTNLMNGLQIVATNNDTEGKATIIVNGNDTIINIIQEKNSTQDSVASQEINVTE